MSLEVVNSLDIREHREKLLEGLREAVQSGVISVRTYNSLRDVVNHYVNPNTIMSYTTGTSILLTAVSLTFSVFQTLLRDERMNQDLNAIETFLTPFIDNIVLVLRRAVLGEERRLLFSRLSINLGYQERSEPEEAAPPPRI